MYIYIYFPWEDFERQQHTVDNGRRYKKENEKKEKGGKE